ncbi:MAG: M56 family metallopeptidase [Bacteroidetes bacterium]|nr:M56 family metallopeptidase [Bacteroidota bacterium]
MSTFYYSFSLTLLHSLWQTMLLLLLYKIMQPLIKKQLPGLKRNILYGLLLVQVIVSVFTFFASYNNSLGLIGRFIETEFASVSLRQLIPEKMSPYIIATYATILCIKSLLLSYNWYRFKKYCFSSLVKPSIDLKLFTLQKAVAFGIKRKVTLWFSNSVTTPLTFGFFKPVILMPVALLNQLPLKDAESLIIHELTHIKNNDYLLNWFLVIMETVFFFNPFIKIIAGNIKLEREKNCDVQVLHFKYPMVDYAETLLLTARHRSDISYFPLAAVFNQNQLLQRIRFFSVGSNLRFNEKKYNRLPVITVLLAIMINLGIVTQLNNNSTRQEVATAAFAVVDNSDNIKDEFPSTVIANKNIAAMQQAVSLAQQELTVHEAQLNEQVKAIQEAAENRAYQEVALQEQSLQIPAEKSMVKFHTIADVQTDEHVVLITEETSGNPAIVTKAYKLTWKNNQWNKELKYVLRENNNVKDSIPVITDSVVRYIPPMQ